MVKIYNVQFYIDDDGQDSEIFEIKKSPITSKFEIFREEYYIYIITYDILLYYSIGFCEKSSKFTVKCIEFQRLSLTTQHYSISNLAASSVWTQTNNYKFNLTACRQCRFPLHKLPTNSFHLQVRTQHNTSSRPALMFPSTFIDLPPASDSCILSLPLQPSFLTKFYFSEQRRRLPSRLPNIEV